MAAERYDAFVSYGHGDAEWVHVLAGTWSGLGCECSSMRGIWLRGSGRGPIAARLAAASAVVFVVSAESVGRGWVNEEFAAAVARAASGSQRLIPVLAGEIDLPPLVASRSYVDFRHASSPGAYEAKVRELAAAIRGQPGRARPAPGGAVVAIGHLRGLTLRSLLLGQPRPQQPTRALTVNPPRRSHQVTDGPHQGDADLHGNRSRAPNMQCGAVEAG